MGELFRNRARPLRKSRRRFAKDSGDDVVCRFALKRRAPCDDLVKRHAQTEDVGPRIHLLSPRLVPADVSCAPCPTPLRPPCSSFTALEAWRYRCLQNVISVNLARPKSNTLTNPSGRTITFSGLTSRCTIPEACAAPSALATCQCRIERGFRRNPSGRLPSACAASRLRRTR